LDETTEGVKEIDVFHDHYDLIGLNGVVDAKLFEVYGNIFKRLEMDKAKLKSFI